MKLRARKGEGHIAAEELAQFKAGLICLTGGEEGPLADALNKGGVARGMECVRELWRKSSGARMFTLSCSAIFSREEEARNRSGGRNCPEIIPSLAGWTNGV